MENFDGLTELVLPSLPNKTMPYNITQELVVHASCMQTLFSLRNGRVRSWTYERTRVICWLRGNKFPSDGTFVHSCLQLLIWPRIPDSREGLCLVLISTVYSRLLLSQTWTILNLSCELTQQDSWGKGRWQNIVVQQTSHLIAQHLDANFDWKVVLCLFTTGKNK